jgi:drug/metabolite transporter (DMT)-like permease
MHYGRSQGKSAVSVSPSPVDGGTKQRLAKATMVPLWSSGFIVGALATQHANSLAVLVWRFTAGAALMAAIALATKARWPRTRHELAEVATVGVLLQAVQFGGLYTSLQFGVPAGLAALLAGSSPLLVAALAALFLDEHLTRRQWIGSAVGVAGVVLATAEELHGTVSLGGIALALVGLAGLTTGTLLQRRAGAAADAQAANTVQLAIAAAVMVPIAAATQGVAVPLTYAALAPLAWLTIALSIGAVLLYFWLLRNQKSGEATSFLYLVPSVTALAAVPILGQPLSAGAVAGLVLAFAGVKMVATSPARRADRPRPLIRRLMPARMELGGLEPPTSWVRSRRSPN